MSMIDASRKLIGELTNMMDKKVKVVLTSGRFYEGVLKGFDHPGLNIILENAVDSSGNSFDKVFVRGDVISEIIALEKPSFNPEELKEMIVREGKIPEHMVKVVPEAGAVIVQGRYRITETGIEGVGPMAELLHEIYKKYMESRRRA